MSQTITIDGYSATITGTIADGDVLAWSTTIVQDPGISLAVSRIAAHVLIMNRGLDPKSEADLQSGYEAALSWARALGIDGNAELDPNVDRTPAKSEYGPLGTGQNDPYTWLDQ